MAEAMLLYLQYQTISTVMLIVGWQVELLMRVKKGFVLTSFFYSVSRNVKMVIN